MSDLPQLNKNGPAANDITFLKGYQAAVTADFSNREIENALLGKTAPSRKDWLNMLSLVIKKTQSPELCQDLNGKIFSEVVDVFSKKLGITASRISSPKDLISVLLIKADLKQLSSKSLELNSLLKVADEYKMPVSELAQLLSFLKQNNYPLNENSLTISIAAATLFKQQHPESSGDLQKTLAYVKKILDSGSLDKIIEDSLDLPEGQPSLTQDDYLRTRIFVYDRRAPKLDFKHQNVKEVMDDVYAVTDKINQKLAEQHKAENNTRDKTLEKKNIAQRTANDEKDQLTLLKKTSAYVGPMANASALELKQSDIRFNAYQRQKQQELLKQSNGGVQAVC